MTTTLEGLDLGSLKRLDQGSEDWYAYRQAASDSLYFTSKSILSMVPESRNAMNFRTHGPLCEVLQDVNEGRIRRLLVSDPRRFLKTTIATRDRMIHKLIQAVVRGDDPCLRFGIRSFSSTNSQRIWREIKTIFESNSLFQFLFPELIPDFARVEGWNQSEGTIPRDYNPKEPTFDCLGGGAAAGRHYDDIGQDDYLNEENVDSPSAIEKAIEYHKQSENLLESESQPIVTVGNFWAMSDLNSYICREEPDTVIFNRSASTGANLEGEWQCRGLPESVMHVLRQAQGELLWPERFDKETLGRLLVKLKPRIFSAQMENNPRDPEATDFKQEWIKRCTVTMREFEGELQPVVTYYERDGSSDEVPLSEMNIYVTWDPALDGKSSTSRNAVLVTGIDCYGRIPILREHAKKEDPRKTIDVFLAYCKAYAGYLKASGVEEVLFAKVLGDLLRERARDQRVWLNLRKLKVPKGMSKEQRLRAWVGTKFEAGDVYVRDGLFEFQKEYSWAGVPGATNDLLDCLGYATQLFIKPATSEHKKRMADKEDRIAMDRGPTGYGSALLLPGRQLSSQGQRLPFSARVH